MEKFNKLLHNMNLHDVMEVKDADPSLKIIRVPGGWLYQMTDKWKIYEPVYVPEPPPKSIELPYDNRELLKELDRTKLMEFVTYLRSRYANQMGTTELVVIVEEYLNSK